jgi:leucyl aminopeptidase
MVNEPANFMTPLQLADEAVKAGKKFGFETEIKDEIEIKELGMEAFLQVAKGSIIPPRLIVMRYNGNQDGKEKLGLVGKGLTYDSGGYSLKSSDGMLTMKCDMGGSAAVIGAMSAIAGNKLKVNVVGVVAACENMLSGSAYRPGDIIGSMGGKSIEVINTDAEGRLTLIDAVHYAQEKEGVNKIVDIATLTGGAMVALGTVRSAVLSNNDDFYSQLESASDECGEKVWRMPTDDEYKELLKSPIADMKNSGGKGASAVTAGLFIEAYIKDIPWLHIDIAGKAFTDKIKYYSPKGGTGLGVRMLYNLAENSIINLF